MWTLAVLMCTVGVSCSSAGSITAITGRAFATEVDCKKAVASFHQRYAADQLVVCTAQNTDGMVLGLGSFKEAAWEYRSGTLERYLATLNQKRQRQNVDMLNHCSSRAWINAFHPEQPVFPKPTDKCPAAETKPLFTREGTLACPSLEAFQAAYNAMTHGWAYVPTAGVSPGINLKVYPDKPMSAEYFGCTIYHDGVAVQISRETFSSAETTIGWIPRVNLRN